MFEKTKQDVKILAFELNRVVPSFSGLESGFTHLRSLLQFGPPQGTNAIEDPLHLRLAKHDAPNMIDMF